MSRRRMKRRATQILVIAASVFVVVLIVAAVAIGLKSIKTLKSITLTPTFAETELDVDTDYQFKIKGNPAKANLKSLEYVVDDATATFDKDADSDKEMAILHTGAEGSITVYVKKGKVVSNKITLQVVDQVKKAEEEAEAQAAKEAEAAAAAEAAAQVEEETAAAEPTLVMVTGDNVRMRAEPNTDCDIVKTCKKGETYTKIEVVDDWTKLDYEGRECYIKTEFLKEVTQEEADQAKADTSNTEEAKKDEKKAEEKKPEEQKPADPAADEAAKKAAEEAAKKAAEDEAAKKAAEDAAAAAAAAQAAAASAGTVTINCSDGPAQFTKAEYDYFVATWSYTGMADEMMGHHSAAELHTLYNNTH